MFQIAAGKCKASSELQNIASTFGLHERPVVVEGERDGVNSRGFLFNPLPGFFCGISLPATVHSTFLFDFLFDEPTIGGLLMLGGTCTCTFKTRGLPSYPMQQNMFLIGRWDNAALEAFFPEQENCSLLVFCIREPALKSYLGQSSYHLVRKRILAAATKGSPSQAVTGLATPKLLIQARQLLEWQEPQDVLGLRCTALDCFAKFFSNPAMLEEPPSSFIFEQDKNRMDKLKAHIEEYFLTIESAADICSTCGMSFSKANKLFKALYSTTVANYIHHCKMTYAYSLLVNRKCNVSECAFEVGYSNISHFSAAFKKCYKVTPKAVTRMRSERRVAG